jgi:release factor glutamine methyltransferase
MKSSAKRVFYDDFCFEVSEDVYEPAEDTILLANCLKDVVEEGDTVLDVGTGCGILAVVAAKRASKVAATDVNPDALECAKQNAEANGVAGKIDVRLGNLFQPIRKAERFDIIIFNAPYLPSLPSEQKTWIGRAWAGGPTGRQLIDRFISKAPCYLKRNGTILLVQSSFADIKKTLEKLQKVGFRASVIAETKVPFETIVVIQASHLSEKSK